MIARVHPVRYAFREYIAHERASNVKHEYVDGQIFAMAGGTPEHAAMISSVNGQLWIQLGAGSCRVMMSDLRIRVLATGLTTYPDISVICGPWERDPDDSSTVVNPTAIVEVLSPSTEAYDRGEKLQHYKQIPSLRSIVLVAHDRVELEVWTREEAGQWGRVLITAGKAAEIAATGCRLDVDAIYSAAQPPQ